ncbi:family 1 glycosylhydrolase [bacterium]|nr:family 1 glycosylhydrolase [bacterium]
MTRTPRSPGVLLRLLPLAVLLGACGSLDGGPVGVGGLSFAKSGSIVTDDGRGSFRFGAATAATQIEDDNRNTDWWVFTGPKEQGGLAKSPFVGEASRGYTLAIEDVKLLQEMHLDSYRFSIEWARIEPRRDVIDEEAIRHYSDLIDALLAAGIKPMVTIHHFSNPTWVDDPRDLACTDGPTDRNLCGLGHPVGGPLVIAEMAEHARLLAERFGDRVDEWGTWNEPMNYVLAAYGLGAFPPGKNRLFNFIDEFLPTIRDMLASHAAMAKAIREADRRDADGDGRPADVGLTLAVIDWVPSRDGQPSDDPADVAARDRLEYALHWLPIDSIRNGTFDANADGVPDEQHPDWQGTLDWLGVQYYFRGGVTAAVAAVPVLDLAPCFDAFDLGACIAPADPTFCVPVMGYEYWAPGLHDLIMDFSGRYPGLPLVVTEAGIQTRVGERRAENVVRTLEQIGRARADGADVRGYYHWSLYDNFEWALGYEPRFGLYSVDFTTYERTPTMGAEVLGRIAEERSVDDSLRERFGGTGPMTPEPGVPENPRTCNRADLAK